MDNPFSGADVVDSRADEWEPCAEDFADYDSDEGDGYGWAEEPAEEPW